ncbi:MAG: right-handed parallel beta-helix repeat-containing protein [Nitrospira sp.]|nr:right-handed parallel beta-helix repeat-containing protein [Nitrospira sp.]
MTNCLIRSPRFVVLSGVSTLLILLGTVTAQGATYYVATTGSDSNAGTSASPWRNPQKCAFSPIKAGDTCIVRTGTYTDSNGDGYVVFVYANRSPSGTASLPITIKSEKPLGAAIIAPSNRNGFGFIVQRPYYIIEGFDISGANNSSSSGAGIGISLQSTATGTIVRSNSIHHIGRASCTNSSSTFSGVQIRGASGAMIERNRIYAIGRRIKGESGCSATNTRHDHGIYIAGGSNITVRRNVIYDSYRGYPIHVYGGTATNLNIYHNTLSGRNPTGSPVAQILLASTIRTANIKNNMSNDAPYGMVWAVGVSAAGVTVSYNMSNTVTNAMAPLGKSASGVAFSNNFDKTSNLGLVSKSTNDFRLASGSAAINRGTTSGVPPVSDGAPDIAAYEYSVQNNLSSPLTPTGLRSL